MDNVRVTRKMSRELEKLNRQKKRNLEQQELKTEEKPKKRRKTNYEIDKEKYEKEWDNFVDKIDESYVQKLVENWNLRLQEIKSNMSLFKVVGVVKQE